jgi:hypothetical protein
MDQRMGKSAMPQNPSEALVAREAAQGEKMIEIKVRFWTDDIAAPGKIITRTDGRGDGLI